jgi:hypothetical protein
MPPPSPRISSGCWPAISPRGSLSRSWPTRTPATWCRPSYRALQRRRHPAGSVGEPEDFSAQGPAGGPARRGGAKSNPSVNLRGGPRTNETHASRTDPEARLYKKASGHEAKLAYLGHALMEHRHGLAVQTCVTQATGSAERTAVLAMLETLLGAHRKTVAADKAYDTQAFVAAVRRWGSRRTPPKPRRSAPVPSTAAPPRRRPIPSACGPGNGSKRSWAASRPWPGSPSCGIAAWAASGGCSCLRWPGTISSASAIWSGRRRPHEVRAPRHPCRPGSRPSAASSRVPKGPLTISDCMANVSMSTDSSASC